LNKADWSFYDFSFGQGLIKHDTEELLIVRFEADVNMNKTNGKLSIFKCMKKNAYIRLMTTALGKIYTFEENPDHMCTLEAPEKLKSLSLSGDGKIIVTCGEGDHVRKWEFYEGLKEGFKLGDIFPNGEIMVKKFCQKRAVRVSKQVSDKPGTSMNVLAKKLVTKCDGTHKSEKVTSLKGGNPAIFVAKVVKNGSEDGEKTLPSVKSRKAIGFGDGNFICSDEKVKDLAAKNDELEKLIRPENKKKMVPVTEFVNLQSENITSSECKKRVVSTAKLVICKAVQIIIITGVCYYFFKDFLSELWNKALFNMTYRVV